MPYLSLLQLSLEIYLSNITQYKHTLQLLPSNIKDTIILHIPRILRQKNLIEDDFLYNALLHNNVRELNISDILITRDILQSISKCNRMQTLSLQKLLVESSDLVNLFTKLQNLQRIEFYDCVKITDDVVESISKNCHYLKIIGLENCISISDISLLYLSKYSEYLQGINLCNTKITDKGIRTLIHSKTGRNMKEIKLSRCSEITNDAIISILVNCLNLQIFVFNHCRNVNVEDLLEEFGNTPHLKQLVWTI